MGTSEILAFITGWLRNHADDMIVNALFFGLDVLLLVIGLPAILKLLNRYEWRNGRKRVGLSADDWFADIGYQRQILSRDVTGKFKELSAGLSEEKRKDFIAFSREVYKVASFDGYFIRGRRSFLDNLQILQPGITPELSLALNDLYTSCEELISEVTWATRFAVVLVHQLYDETFHLLSDGSRQEWDKKCEQILTRTRDCQKNLDRVLKLSGVPAKARDYTDGQYFMDRLTVEMERLGAWDRNQNLPET